MRQYILTCIIFILMVFQVSAQSGWTRKAKSYYLLSSLSYYSSKDYYTTEGNLSNTGSRFNSSALLFYGEYGVTDRITASLDLPVIMLNSFSSTETVGGVGSVNLGLKYKLFKKAPIAFQAIFEIPTNNGINLARAKKANELGTFDEINLPTSDGEFNVWANLIASKSFPDGKTYGSIYTGINFRTNSFSNQFHAGAEVGHLFFKRLYLIGKLRIQEKLDSGNENQNGSFLYGEGTTFTSLGLNAIYKLGRHLSVLTGYADYTDLLVKRKNIYDGGIFTLGISFGI
ncbi:hypothetical protein V8G69_15415 [Gaetbulibacter sp. M235]|uniref:hypothetical protein n=1 Tax=Gaetbulibacter sp. M235 TaxID=3126510 RepID=UPI00374ED9C6